jgi:hypothetical protein
VGNVKRFMVWLLKPWGYSLLAGRSGWHENNDAG